METQIAVAEATELWAGPFHLIKRLGEGGYGEVYEAWDPRLRRSLALKRLKAGGHCQGDRLLAEGQLAASLSHPAFVRIFSVEGEGSSQAIAMELVPGCTLARFAADRAPTEDLVLNLIAQVAEAMVEAHAAGLVHADLKPSNVMVEPSGRIRILDFGLARLLDPLATQSLAQEGAIGTIAYMAPERLAGEPPRPQGDIYALGVMLYQLVAGRLPFPHLNGLALAAAQAQSSSTQWPLPPGTSAAVGELIRAMTARDCDQRLASMRAAAEAIAAIEARGRTPARLPPESLRPAARPWPAWLRPRSLLLAAGAIMVAAAATLVVVAPPAAPSKNPSAQAPYSETVLMESGLRALRVFDRDGSIDAAVASFNAILARSPHHAGAMAGLSLAYSLRYSTDSRDESWLARAAASAQQAVLQDDHLALAIVAEAWVRERQGDLAPALGLVERALAIDPRNVFGRQAQITVLTSMNRLTEAATAVDQAIGMYPAERWFTDSLGVLALRRGDYSGAERAFRKSIALDPDSSNSYASLNIALLGQNREADALQALQQGLQAHPNSRLYGNLGTTLFMRGDYAGAASAFERAISARSGSPNYYLDWANLADALRWLPGREAASRQAYESAFTLLAPLLERAGGGTTTQQSRLGLYAAKLGRPDSARRWTAKALAAAPANADVQFRAAMAYELLGERERALAAVRESLAHGYPPHLVAAEPDLLSLRRDVRYHLSTKEKQ